MPRSAALTQLARQLAAACDATDWAALEHLTASLAKNLPLLHARGAWNQAELLQLQQLRKIHAEALKICSAEKDRLGLRLGALQANKEGWVAYAAFGELDQYGNQA